MKLIPLPGVVIVKPREFNRKTKSGFIIGAGAENKRFLKGEVVEVAKFSYIYDKDKKIPIGKVPIDLKKGDTVIFEESFARDYIVNGIKYFFCTAKDIYTKVEGENEVE